MGLAARLMETVVMYRSEARGNGREHEALREGDTFSECHKLDDAAEAMRVRRAAEALPGFWELARLADGRWRIICGGEHYMGQSPQAAYDALQKAGKL